MSASGNKNRTNSQSSSGGSNMSQSGNSSFNNSAIAGDQLPFLQNLWGQAQGQAQANEQTTMNTQQQNQGWLNQGANAIGGLMDPSSQIAAQSASLQSGLGDMFRNEIMPALDSNSIMSGGFGGGRQGVAQSNAVGELANAYTTGLGDITARANSQALSAAGQMPGYSAANMANTMSGWDNLSNFANILGGPTVLQNAGSAGWSNASGNQWAQGSGSGKSGGFGFGL